MAKLYNLARMTTATVGTGTITLGSAMTGFLSFSGSGVVDGEVVAYGIQDGNNSEVGEGTYTAAGTTLTRTVTNSTNSNTAISLSGSAQVFITPSSKHIGKWTNRRVAKTANYTLANTDDGATIALGGSAFFTLTVSAASGYGSDFACMITNEDSTVSGGTHTGRGKSIAINGYPSFILWPGQSFFLFNQNNAWRFDYPGRWRCQGAPTIYVNHASGSDSNDGLSTGASALATMQQAIYCYEHFIDCNGFGPTIQSAAETFTENNVVHTHPIVGYHVISITGDTVTPSNCVWQISGTGNTAFQCRDGGMAIVTGFKFVNTGTNGFFLNGGQEGVCDFGSMEFGANSGGYHLSQSSGGSMNWFGGSLKVSANMNGFLLAGGEGHTLIDGATINIPSAITFFQFLQMNALSFCSATSITFTGTGAGAASTGSTYTVTGNAVLSKSGTTFPGTSTSGAATGGQII
jgi:hypothetical protein